MPLVPFVLALLAVVWFSATGDMGTFEKLFIGFPLLLAAAGVGWGIARWKRRRVSALPVALLALVALLVLVTNWPLRASFAVARPGLECLAADVRAGRHPRLPHRAGLFQIREALVEWNGAVCLWTDPTGRAGFVERSPAGDPCVAWEKTTLDRRWQFLVED